MEPLTQRQQRLLGLVVREYVDTAEPVGSVVLCSKYSDLDCSTATVRNELAYLEKEGFLTHPYTSAGRIPTDKGYRFYVDKLMDAYSMTTKEQALIDTLQGAIQNDISNIMNETVRVLDSISSNYASIINANESFLAEITKKVAKNREQSRREAFQLRGLSRLLYEPEFDNVESIRRTVGVLDRKERLIELLDNYSDPKKAAVSIGQELHDAELSELSLVSRDFHYQGERVGSLSVLGPTRMKYSKITVAIDSIAQILDDLFECM